MKLSRRNLLKLGVGASQLALLGGLPSLARRVRADGTGPSRVLTIYLSGGYTPQYFYAPFTAAQVTRFISPPRENFGETVGYLPEQVMEVGGGGGGFSPIRIARTWDPAQPSRRTDASGNRVYLPLGYSWLEHDLFSRAVVLHGIDQGTASHESGYIAAMCGVAGSEYRAPAIQSTVANFLYDAYADTRPLPCVGLDARGLPNALTLPARSAASYVPDMAAVRRSLSDKEMGNPWWKGLNVRNDVPDFDFFGAPDGMARQTAIEQRILSRTRAQGGRSTPGTDAFLTGLHDAYRGVSKALARNIAELLAATPGVEHLTGDAMFAGMPAYGDGVFGYHLGYANQYYTDGMFNASFDMALRLMKADLSSAIHLYMPAFYYDTHSGKAGHGRQFLEMRGGMDVIARFLGEMQLTTLANGRNLLDDTLVVIFSEFARTWSSFDGMGGENYPDDHWPTTSVTLVGGGIQGGREIGGFDLDAFSYGPRGKPVDIIEESGETSRRVPRAADVAATICRIMGMQPSEFFIPGGYGEIVGARAT